MYHFSNTTKPHAGSAKRMEKLETCGPTLDAPAVKLETLATGN